jgi:putative NADH-flavin reductase
MVGLLTEADMRLFVLGASGGIGRQMIGQALKRGDQVTAFVRSPDKLGPRREGLTIHRGDPRDAAQLTEAMPGHDAVLSMLGPPGRGPTTIMREGARSTVTAMQAVGMRRLLVVSAAVLFDGAGIIVGLMRRTLLRNVAQDSAEMEHIVMASGMDWTIARPPRLTNGPLTKRYKVEDGRMPRGKWIVSRADVADFLLDELHQGTHTHKIVGMAR